MNLNYSGEITVTGNLFLKLADENFLKFTGMDMYASVGGVFAEQDADVIRNAAERIKKESSFSAVLRLRRADGIMKPVVVTFRGANEDGEALIRMEMTELAGYKEQQNKYGSLRVITNVFCDILGSVLFEYNCAQRHFEIFYISDQRRRVVYDGSLENWRGTLVADKVDVEFIDELGRLCDDLAMANKNFSHTIKITELTEGSGTDVYTFKGRSAICPDGTEMVLGVIETGGADNLKSLNIDPVNDKDSFLDMLNKRAVIEHAKHIISMPSTEHSYFIIVDLDNFKSVNDVYGHIVGDEVLVKVTKIINESLGRRGIVGRVGGDEILIVTETINENTELRNMLRSIRTAVEWTFRDDPRALNVTCSIGVCCYPDNGKDFNSLYELADKMLYIAKAKGKNRYIIYTPELHDPILAGKAAALASPNVAAAKDLVQDKVGIMHRLIDNYLTRHSYTNEMIFSEIGAGFGLDEILVLYENFTNVFYWTHETVSTDMDKVPYFTPDAVFGEMFNKDNMLVLDGLYKLDGKCPVVEKSLEEKGIKSALFYRIDRMGKFSGYVMFGKRTQRQMWSEYEIMALGAAAKVFDVSMHE